MAGHETQEKLLQRIRAFDRAGLAGMVSKWQGVEQHAPAASKLHQHIKGVWTGPERGWSAGWEGKRGYLKVRSRLSLSSRTASYTSPVLVPRQISLWQQPHVLLVLGCRCVEAS